MSGPVRLILHHAWVGVMAAPEIQRRSVPVARDGIAIAPFHMMYCSPASRLGLGGGVEDSDSVNGMALGILLMGM